MTMRTFAFFALLVTMATLLCTASATAKACTAAGLHLPKVPFFMGRDNPHGVKTDADLQKVCECTSIDYLVIRECPTCSQNTLDACKLRTITGGYSHILSVLIQGQYCKNGHRCKQCLYIKPDGSPKNFPHANCYKKKNIVQLAVGTKDLSTLVAALKAGQLVSALEGKGPFTVFAPTNAAFAKLPKATLNHLLDPKALSSLQAVLEYHVVSGAIYSKSLKAVNHVKTLESEQLLVEKHAGGVTVNRKSHVTTADVRASNGVVHIVDAVLIPPSMLPPSQTVKNIVNLAAGTKDLSTLVAALKAGNLVNALEGTGPFTVFAPTNEAFAKLPKATLNSLLQPKNIRTLQAVLEYHVVSGSIYSSSLKSENTVKTLESETMLVEVRNGGVTINHAAHVTMANVAASNGVVHIIDAVLLPPSMTKRSIVELAAGNKDLSTLVAALTAGKLVTALEAKGPFTVFAPTNEAFAKLPKATLKSLLEPKNIKQLDAVLEYHVVAGAAVFSKSLKASQRVKTLQGSTILVQRSWRGVYINGKSKVTTADVKATNGVVHIINTVLLPPQPKKKCTINVPAEKQPEYAFEFAALDKDHNGYLNAKEFKDMGVRLAIEDQVIRILNKFEDHRKKGHTWGKSWGGRRLRSSWQEALLRQNKEKQDAYRAARVSKKFHDNNSRYISLCEFENAMYKESLQDGGDNDGPVVVH